MLEERLVVLERDGTNERDSACDKLNHGGLLTRSEAAAFLSVSTRKLQRLEASGTLQRCPNLGTLVRYSSRDVLRLASAHRKER